MRLDEVEELTHDSLMKRGVFFAVSLWVFPR